MHLIEPSYTHTTHNVFFDEKTQQYQQCFAISYFFDLISGELSMSHTASQQLNNILQAYQSGYDLGYPKAQAEYLVFSQLGIPAKPKKLAVSIAGTTKTLVLQPSRVWEKTATGDYLIKTRDDEGQAIMLDYAQAYGGKDYATNPKGIGYLAQDKQTSMPHLEYPNQTPLSPLSKNITPAGFSPLPIDSSLRTQYLGKYTKAEEAKIALKPTMPKSTQPQYYYLAPQDQWLNALNHGDVYSLTGFTEQPIQGRIPDYQPVLSTLDTQGKVTTHSGRFDTIVFFPNQKLGVMIYRVVIPSPQLQADHIQTYMVQLEESNSPYTPNQRQQSFQDRVGGQKQLNGLKEEDLLPISWQSGDDIAQQHADNQARFHDAFATDLDDSLEIPTWVTQTNTLNYDSGFLDHSVLPYALDQSPSFNIDTPINAPKWENPQAVLDQLQTQTEQTNSWRESCLASLTHPEAQTHQNLDAQAVQITHNHFSQTQFHNSNFTQAHIANTHYDQVSFEQSNFSQSRQRHNRYTDCHFKQVDFTHARFKDTQFENCTFEYCNFAHTQIEQCDFYQCNFSRSQFQKELWFNTRITDSELSQCQFDKSQHTSVYWDNNQLKDNIFITVTFDRFVMTNTQSLRNRWDKVGFTNSCHFSNLDFNQDQFIQCAFARSLLEKVNISTSLWQRNDCSEIHATELKLDNVDASGSDFVNAYLINSHIQQCQLKQSNFTGAFLSGSDIQGSNLEHATYAYAESDKVVDWKQKADIDIQVEKTEINYEGYPTTTIEVNIANASVGGSVSGYRYFGTMGLSGDMSVTDTKSPYSNVSLSQHKTQIENEIVEEVRKWIHNDYGKPLKDQKDEKGEKENNASIVDVVASLDLENKEISLSLKFGDYTLNANNSSFVVDPKTGNTSVKGSLTKSSDSIAIDNRFTSSSSLTIDVNLIFIRDGSEAKQEQRGFLNSYAVPSLHYVSIGLKVVGTGISFIPNPIAKGVGAGLNVAGTGLGMIGRGLQP